MQSGQAFQQVTAALSWPVDNLALIASWRASVERVLMLDEAVRVVTLEAARTGDTALNLEALRADIIVLRHSSPGSSHFLAQRLESSIINAGDGAHEHPTQGLLDIFTMREKHGRIAGLNVLIVGDILFSRVARSNIFGLLKLGANVTLVGPSTLVPRSFEKLGVRVAHRIDDVLPEADVVNLLRIQHERQRQEYFPGLGEYTSLFGLTKARAARLKPTCLIMHPGPINRGVEIDSDVADGPQSVILEQVTNGIAVRMAVLYSCAIQAPRQTVRPRSRGSKTKPPARPA